MSSSLFKTPNCISSLFTFFSIYSSSHGAHSSMIGFPPLHSRRLFSVNPTRSFPRSLVEVAKAVLSRASGNHESVAIRVENKSYSYAQLISSACKISSLLCSEDFKSTKEGSDNGGFSFAEGNFRARRLQGARVGIVAKPSAEFVAAVLGTWLSGGVAVPLALIYPEAELLYVMKDSITKESFIDGGFFMTGDTVTVDEDGYYVILGRSNADIMKVGGFKLSALEIEAVLLEHEAVSECCVLGLPDEDYGEIVCAIIVPHEEIKRRAEQELKPAITLEELRNWAKKKLAPYKIPTSLFLWGTLPRNAMGKVNKKELKRLLEERSSPS